MEIRMKAFNETKQVVGFAAYRVNLFNSGWGNFRWLTQNGGYGNRNMDIDQMTKLMVRRARQWAKLGYTIAQEAHNV